MQKFSLTKFAWLSILTALITISLKYSAYAMTGSVGLLSDAIESIVNLAAAIIALLILKVAEKPPDEDHMYGHNKAEYFSSVFEGVLIVIAAFSIIITAVNRLIHPEHLSYNFLGLSITIIASLVNLIVAKILIKNGKKHSSITLEADGKHLMTDVITSIGVLIGVGLVFITKFEILDPIIAILVGINIIYSGWTLIYRSAMGFLDASLPLQDLNIIKNILDLYCTGKINYHDLRTRQSGTRRFVSFHVLVPGSWSIQKGHNLLENIEKDISTKLKNTTVSTHIEPLEDTRAWNDTTLDR